MAGGKYQKFSTQEETRERGSDVVEPRVEAPFMSRGWLHAQEPIIHL